MNVTIIPIVIGAFGTVTKGFINGPGGFESGRPSGDHPNYSIIENGQNTEKSPGDLRRLAITQSPVENHLNYSIVEIGQNTKKSPGGLRKLAVTHTPERDHRLMLM